MANTKFKGEKYEALRQRAMEDLRGMALSQIEERLIVIEEEKIDHVYDSRDRITPYGVSKLAELEKEQKKLELQRRFILDKRGGWKSKLIWSFAIPIVVSLITALIVSSIL